ncbi:helix-turn-helix domain-containing protein [Microbulbifer sp. PAAF003]|uniref:helix-turn-helix domain-containing protein n=1 Tax=Microbulbifer sp. PAAF003 TaxID=3243375 RepID=UPI00403A5031
MPDSEESVVFKIQGKMVVGQRKFRAPLSYQDRLVDEARLVYVISGCSTLVCGDESLTLSPGATVLMKTDNFINQWHEDGINNEINFIGFRLTSELLQRLYPSGMPDVFGNNGESRVAVKEDNKSINQPPSAERLQESVLLSNYMRSIIDYIQQPEVFSEPLVVLKVRELVELIPRLDSSGTVVKMLGQLFIRQQPKLQEVVQAHLYSSLKLADLAFLCHMSESTFTRKFKQVYGSSATKYITSKRMEKAQQLILNSDLSLTEVALECGFDELSYFSRVFKQHYQVAPSQMRKKAI